MPDDFARCVGVGFALECGEIDWRDGCERCLRRLTPPGEHPTWWIEPPPVIAFECEFLVTEAA